MLLIRIVTYNLISHSKWKPFQWGPKLILELLSKNIKVPVIAGMECTIVLPVVHKVPTTTF